MRIITLLLLLCLFPVPLALAADAPAGVPTRAPGEAVTTSPEPTAPPPGIQPGTSLAVGTSTAMHGRFGLEMFGENTADVDVWSLIHGYPTVSRTQRDGFCFNPTALSSVTVEDAADCGQRYTFEITPGLTYNNGLALTASDYVFSVLLSSAPQTQALGGRAGNWAHVDGFDAYAGGDADTLSGLRLLSDSSFSITIASDCETLFYGVAMLRVTPHPPSIIAPGCTVRDDGRGAYIDGPFTEDALRATILDPDSGYLYHPTVTSGAYTLTGYDVDAGTATFEANPRYQGNYAGAVPAIERLTFTYIPDSEMIGALASGEVDLLNKVTGLTPVTAGQELASRQDGYAESTYLRDGLAYLSFACDTAPTDSEAVRRAIAMALDRDAFVEQEAGPSAHRVYGYYGLGQWMTAYTATLADGSEVRVADALQSLDIPHDPDGAAALLAEDGWTLNADGNAYTPGQDAVRYRRADDGSLTPLVIRWARAGESDIAARLEPILRDSLAAIGVGLEADVLPFDILLSHYYRQETPAYNLYFMGSNFQDVFDPLYDFNTEDAIHGNVCGIRDAELSALARDMRATSTDERSAYVARWLQYQSRFMELVPMIPLYSNVYFDFYRDTLRGYDIANYATWGEAVLDAWIAR
ncbi:ABC transporter substrate-binding protein [Eubacteriales bacterium OttesenSCG-928-A19]|nr:ABC transporter substrate-binding protein [Eubacteriales bacterium OttesenSCG-928-A19]